jgi:hypothetical protein
VADHDLIGSVDPNQDSESGYGSGFKQTKLVLYEREKEEYHAWRALWRAGGFSWSLDILFCDFCDFQASLFKIFGIKSWGLDPDSSNARIRIYRVRIRNTATNLAHLARCRYLPG